MNDFYYALLLMSAAASIPHLLLKLPGKRTRHVLTATWHYYSRVFLYTLFFIISSCGTNRKRHRVKRWNCRFIIKSVRKSSHDAKRGMLSSRRACRFSMASRRAKEKVLTIMRYTDENDE